MENLKGTQHCDQDPPPAVIYTLKTGLHYNYNGTSRHLIESEGSNAALDYWYEGRTIVWSNIRDEQLYICTAAESVAFGDDMASCNGSSGNLTVISEQAADTEGLAIDWVHKLLFRTDSHHDKLFVMDMRSMREIILVDSDLDEPRAIAVDPATGLIF